LLFHLAIATVFGIGIFALLYARRTGSPSHRLVAGLSSGLALTLMISVPLFDQDWMSLYTGAMAATLFSGALAVARHLYPQGIDRFDIGFCAFVAFVLGVGGWRLASQTLVLTAVISGLIGIATLFDSRRENPFVPFEFVLGAVAVGAMFLR